MLAPRTKHLDTLLVKPAGPDCNLDCTYCFYLEKERLFPAGAHRMSSETLEMLIRQAMEQSGPRVSFAWQGGEPTLMGLPWFEQAVNLEKRYGTSKSVGNALQTNGLLLDDEWATFLKEYRFLVGLSIDGPRHVHDRHRITRGRNGSWETVVAKATLLMEKGVETNALTVVTDYAAEHPDEIYTCLKALGFRHMQFIPCVERSVEDPSRPAPFSVSAEAYGRFLVRMFDLWQGDFVDGIPTVSVRYFDSVFHKYVGMSAPDCTLRRTCGTYLVVEHNGDVYTCDFFVDDAWKLGNIREDRLSEMLNAERQRAFGDGKADLPAICASCRWLPNCWGGCPRDRIGDRRNTDPNHFCRSYTMFFEHADAKLTELALRWRRQNRSTFPTQASRGQW